MLLGKLPLELREQIYSYVLPPHLQSVNPIKFPAASRHLTNHGYAIFNIDRATREDVGLSYLRTRAFEIIPARSSLLFRQYLDSFPGELGYESVRSIEFHRFYEQLLDATGSVDMSIILRCAQLRTLTLWFDMHHEPMHFRKGNAASRREEQRGEADLFQAYQLHRLFALVNVKEIELKWFLGWRSLGNCLMMATTVDGIVYDTLSFAERLKKIEDSLRVGFEARGRFVNVRIRPQ